VLYYDEAGLLFALHRGGAHYFVAADQVGTPRVVTDSKGCAQCGVGLRFGATAKVAFKACDGMSW
jgi:hypothetical protein